MTQEHDERRLALFRELENRVVSGSAYVLRTIDIITHVSIGMSLVITNNDFSRLCDCVEGEKNLGFIELKSWRDDGRFITVKLRSDWIGGLIESHCCYTVLADGKVYSFSNDDVTKFREME